MKNCISCGESKSLDSFYKHPRMGDGRLNKCKECCKVDVQQNYRKNRDHFAEYEKQRNQDPKRRELKRKYAREYARRNPEKRRARLAISNALRDGRLKKKPCEVCGVEKVEAHHKDYTKPLLVNWLCKKHHMEADKLLK